MESENRVVVLIDMDCFYCQVEEKLNPSLKGKPIAVVQYNPWKGGGIIAVNYVARAMGVTRHMRGDEAKEKCPEIELPSVPCSRGKADITKYREAGKEVAKVLQKYTSLLERASIDEAYLDITLSVEERLRSLNINTVTTDLIPNTYTLGYESVNEFLSDVHRCGSDSIEFDYEHAKRLMVGAVIVSEIRAAVYEETGYRCSAGIAHNKILAKLVCGMNKPNKQTILPKHSIDILYKNLSVKKVKHLGGKFGDTVCEVLKIKHMAELQLFSERELQNKFDEKNGTWLYNIARGIDLEPVQARFNPKSIGCCKQFKGKAALLDLDSLKKWLKDLGDEIEDRLEKDSLENNRTPRQMVISYSTQLSDGRDTSSSRSYNFCSEEELGGDLFSNKSLELIMESLEGIKPKEDDINRKLKAPIKFLGISVGKFEDNSDVKKTKKIKDYFNTETAKTTNKVVEKGNTMKKENIKSYILEKFFQTSDINKKDDDPEIELLKNSNIHNNASVLESALSEQESFFAKLLNKKVDSDATSIASDFSYRYIETKPKTPICEVTNHGENSNDTEFSGSTINMEINNSIALFENDPKDVERVNNIRELLNNSRIINDNDKSLEHENVSSDCDNIDAHEDVIPNCDNNQHQPGYVAKSFETFDCIECGKTIPIDKVEMHADYHFALKLREEERKDIRKEVANKKLSLPDVKKKRKPPDIRNDCKQSITDFFTRMVAETPTQKCNECNKPIPIENFSLHLDFHEAQKISRELNNKTPLLGNNENLKRKRKSASPVKKNKVPKCKSIETFFK